MSDRRIGRCRSFHENQLVENAPNRYLNDVTDSGGLEYLQQHQLDANVCDSSLVKLLLNYRANAGHSLDGPRSTDAGSLSLPPSATSANSSLPIPLLHQSADLSKPSEVSEFHIAGGHKTVQVSEAEGHGRRHHGPVDQHPKRGRQFMSSSLSPEDANGGQVSTSCTASWRGPLLLGVDRTSDHILTNVYLEGETISAFQIGGEPRLCLPQVLSLVLGCGGNQTESTFSVGQINAACDRLQIHCAASNHVQLAALRRQSALPPQTTSCGLITFTDAYRLCNALLRCDVEDWPQQTPSDDPDILRRGIPVVHRCFGRCSGLLFASSVTLQKEGGNSPDNEEMCSVKAVDVEVRCDFCRRWFGIEQFVSHSHGNEETRIVHWGFDAANWAHYVHVPEPLPPGFNVSRENVDRLHRQLEIIKETTSARRRLGDSRGNAGDTKQALSCDKHATSVRQPMTLSRGCSPVSPPPASSRPLRKRPRFHSNGDVIVPSSPNGNNICSSRQLATEILDRTSIHRDVVSAFNKQQTGAVRQVPVDSTSDSQLQSDAEKSKQLKVTASGVHCNLAVSSDMSPREMFNGCADKNSSMRATSSIPLTRQSFSPVVRSEEPEATIDSTATGSSSLIPSVVAILQAEVDLFTAALRDVETAEPSGGDGRKSSLNERRAVFLTQFTTLQHRHMDVVNDVLVSQCHLQQELNALRERLNRCRAQKEEETFRCRQLETLRREDEIKLRNARLENDQLRTELEAMISGTMRSDIGLVKAKYKARAKHFERKFRQVEEANALLIDELNALRQTVVGASASSPRVLEKSCGDSLRNNCDGIGHSCSRDDQDSEDTESQQNCRAFDVVAASSHNSHLLSSSHCNDVVVPVAPLSPPSSVGERSPPAVVLT